MYFPIKITDRLMVTDMCEIHSDSDRRPVSFYMEFFGTYCHCTIDSDDAENGGFSFAEADTDICDSFETAIEDNHEKIKELYLTFLSEEDED